MKEKPLILVEWEDAHTAKMTQNYEDIISEKLLPAKTVGWLINYNKEVIAICGFVFDNGIEQGFRDTHYIPRSWIKKVTKLNAGKDFVLDKLNEKESK